MLFSLVELVTNTGIMDKDLMPGVPDTDEIKRSKLYRELVEDCGGSRYIMVFMRTYEIERQKATPVDEACYAIIPENTIPDDRGSEKMKHRQEIYSEWFRLISKEGLTTEHGSDETLVFRDGEPAGRITDEGDVFIKPGHRETMNRVYELLFPVKEYVTAYCEAPAAELPNGYRKISDLGQYVLAAKQMKDKSFEFVAWQYSSYDKSSVAHGNYFNDYEAAKTDFGVRAGMIDLSRLFSESELLFLHNALCRYVQYDDRITYDDEQAAVSLREKIEDIMPGLDKTGTPEQGREDGPEPE